MEAYQQPAYSPIDVMERVMVEVRQRWFDATVQPDPWGLCVKELQGELLFCVQGQPDDSAWMAADIVSRGACVVITTDTAPANLHEHLEAFGYRSVQAHGVYRFEPDLHQAAGPVQGKRTLWQRLQGREPAQVVVEEIGLERLADWNAVCWAAFGRRHELSFSYQEKKRAVRNMGRAARWYLASLEGRPVGTAVLYQSESAAQILAVGTLPGYRGRGVATAIMRQAIADWQAKGHGMLFLDTEAGSRAARLYEQLGFRQLYSRSIYAPPYLS